eukprot:3392683-Pleurochrysis_carterae.AAC.3
MRAAVTVVVILRPRAQHSGAESRCKKTDSRARKVGLRDAQQKHAGAASLTRLRGVLRIF